MSREDLVEFFQMRVRDQRSILSSMGVELSDDGRMSEFDKVKAAVQRIQDGGRQAEFAGLVKSRVRQLLSERS